MASFIPDKMLLELEQIEQDATIELFDLDLSRVGGGKYYFHNGLNERYENIKWQGFTYEAFPCQMDGITMKASGASNRPTFVCSNLMGIVTGLVSKYKEMVGGELIKREVYAKFLDKENFKDNVNPYADPTQEHVTIYTIERLTKMDIENASFELSLPLEAEGALVPGRIITCDSCAWEYRGEGCGYNGNRFFDRFGNPVGSRAEDECGKRESDCNKRFRPNGENKSIPISMFPSANKIGG